MSTPCSLPRPATLRSLLWGVALMLALLLPAASASAWTREAAPVQDPSIFQPEVSMTVLPDGTARYLARGAEVGGDQTNRLVVRPPAGPAAFASPFPALLGQDDGFTGFLALSPADGAGNQLVVREVSPYAVGFLSAASDTGAAAAEPTEQITQIDLAPSGEAAAIVSEGSTAAVSFRPAGPAGRFDALRPLDRAGNMRSYGIGITIDPDGGDLRRLRDAAGIGGPAGVRATRRQLRRAAIGRCRQRRHQHGQVRAEQQRPRDPRLGRRHRRQTPTPRGSGR